MNKTTLVAEEISRDVEVLRLKVEQRIIKAAAAEGMGVEIKWTNYIEHQLDRVQRCIDGGIEELNKWFTEHSDEVDSEYQGIDATIGALHIKPAGSAPQYKGIEINFFHNVDNKALDSYISYRVFNNMTLSGIKYTKVNQAIEKLKLFNIVGRTVDTV